MSKKETQSGYPHEYDQCESIYWACQSKLSQGLTFLWWTKQVSNYKK